jgi:hypothetical protein
VIQAYHNGRMLRCLSTIIAKDGLVERDNQ